MKTINGTWVSEAVGEGQSTYEIFAAIDAKTRNCELMWTDEFVGDNGDTYSGQYSYVGDEPLGEGVGRLFSSNGYSWNATWKNGE